MGLSPQWLLTPTSGRGTFSQLFRSWRKSFACILPQDRGHEPCNPLNPRAKLHANQPRIKVVDYTATDVCRVSCGLPAGVHALTVAVPPGGGRSPVRLCCLAEQHNPQPYCIADVATQGAPSAPPNAETSCSYHPRGTCTLRRVSCSCHPRGTCN